MSPTAATPTVRHVDGHTLSHLHSRTTTTSLVPILTPPIHSSSSGKKNSDDRQYILVPNSQRIVVRSAHHGKKICDLIILPTRVDGDDNGGEQERNDDLDIRAVTLAWLPSSPPSTGDDDDDDDGDHANGEWVILAGCKNGMVHEWSVSNLSSSGGSGTGGRSSRRSFQLVVPSGNKSSMKKTALELMHLACPSSTDEAPPSFSGGNIMLYGLVTKTMIPTDDTSAKNAENSAPSSSSTTTTKKNSANVALSTSSTTTWLVRMEIPPYVVPSTTSTTTYSSTTSPHQPLPIKTLLFVKNVPSNAYNEGTKQNKFVCLKKNDSIFGFLASYRRQFLPNVSRDRSMLEYRVDGEKEVDDDATRGDVFVVMCSSHGLAIYRDSLTTKNSGNMSNSSPSTKLVHFAKMMKATNKFIPEEEMIITSLAISPDTKDLALGRGGGQIEILDNIFDNVANFLDRRKQLLVEKKTKGDFDSLQRLSQQHPEEVTIRRNVHWHAHPVRTLAFMSTSSGRLQSGGDGGAANTIANPMSLLSGGEESVLVTWQLDRNFHRPSHFVARVGRGGIVHMLTCRSSGKIIVFCSDNSMQCFDSSTYERDWAEFGLAAMALHGEEEREVDDSRRRGKRSPIIMVKDPITNIPMLTNLPGAPGMIHWYDPNLASVVGTLEVAPYNRVSRRDPTDPHVPAPAVTHMAVGQSGKDLVTVDTVWTENTTVGAACNLLGPKGNITHMNVITCIKFWTHVESSTKLGKSSDYQRKRRNGDVPMSYELVASMSAPHGKEGMVCALSMAPNGNVACTLSREEDAFRIWAKKTDDTPSSAGGAGVRSTVWKCLYVVKTPSGFANQLAQSVNSSSVGQQLVAFSSDGSVLSVAYGPYVTLWDHSNVTLLTSISTMDNAAVSGLSENIESVNFLTGNDDAMLLTTAHQIKIESPFGGVNSYLGDDEWLFNAAFFGNEAILLGKDASISTVVPLLESGESNRGTGGFAVSMTLQDSSKSIISIVNREKGGVAMLAGTNTPIRWLVDGEVQSLCVERNIGSAIQLLAVMKDCRMLSLRCGLEEHNMKKGHTAVEVRSNIAHAPVLKIGHKVDDDQKSSVKKRKVSIGMSPRGLSSKRSFSGFEFPSLSGKFTSAFIAQSLGRETQ